MGTLRGANLVIGMSLLSLDVCPALGLGKKQEHIVECAIQEVTIN